MSNNNNNIITIEVRDLATISDAIEQLNLHIDNSTICKISVNNRGRGSRGTTTYILPGSVVLRDRELGIELIK